MTDVVLLGAGASFGSGPMGPRRLPLGKDLFEELVKVGPTWRALPAQAAEEFRRDGLFEPGFDWVSKNCDDLSMHLIREMALYFLKFRPTLENSYFRLVPACEARGDVQLATLNYDVLLDCAIAHSAAGRVDYGLNVDGRLGILPLHGSPHLLPDIPVGRMQGVTFSNNGLGAMDVPMVRMSPPAAKAYLEATDCLAPGMAMYAPGKRVLVSPCEVTAMQAAYGQASKGARRIYLVGVSYQPHDGHVWDPVANSEAEVVVANPNPQDFEALRARIGDRLTVVDMKFDQFVEAFAAGTI